MNEVVPKVVERFITVLACVFLFSVIVLTLTGVGYVVFLVIKNMRAW